MLGFVKRNIKTRSHNIKTKAYKALVRPRIEYCASVWDPHTQSAIQKIEMVQRRAARYVLRRYHNTSSVSDMLEQVQWPTLAQRRCCLRLTMLFKIKNSIVTINPTAYLKPIRTTTRTNVFNMHLVGKLLFPLCLFLLVALLKNRLCTSTHTRQTIYNQDYGYQTFKQNLQAHTNTQSNQPSN